jgi:hypothetical protein
LGRWPALAAHYFLSSRIAAIAALPGRLDRWKMDI